MLFRISEPRASQVTSRGYAGLTLVEMLISMAVTLVMMAAVVNLFANIGQGVRTRRASMELGSELRQARARLFKDLAGATCAARPKLPSDDHDDGYLEIVEGEFSDKNPSILVDRETINGEIDYQTSIIPSSNVAAADQTDGGGLGDYDDILALTVRSESEPFSGAGLVRNNATSAWVDGTIESDLAEIVWYAVENPSDGSLGEPGMRTLYRRVLLIAPWVDLSGVAPVGTTVGEVLHNFYAQYDISVRLEEPTTGSYIFVPNTLSDLTKRENRFAHLLSDTGGLGFPFAISQAAIRATTYDPLAPPVGAIGPLRPFGSPFHLRASPGDNRRGEDVMLNDVLAFDLRVFDPGAPLFAIDNLVFEPSDVGWGTAPSANLVGVGAYADLFWNHTSPSWRMITIKTWTKPAAGAPAPLFANAPNPKSKLNFSIAPLASVTYDTWPYSYENDGINQDGDALIDEGTDGLDNDGVNGVDDPLERETAPPYDTPLRGMQAKLRVYDRDTRQIREATVTRNFVPQ